MARPEELGRVGNWLKRGLDQYGREVCLKILNAGLADLSSKPGGPRVFRLMPSRVLDFPQLSFRSSCSLGWPPPRGENQGR